MRSQSTYAYTCRAPVSTWVCGRCECCSCMVHGSLLYGSTSLLPAPPPLVLVSSRRPGSEIVPTSATHFACYPACLSWLGVLSLGTTSVLQHHSALPALPSAARRQLRPRRPRSGTSRSSRHVRDASALGGSYSAARPPQPATLPACSPWRLARDEDHHSRTLAPVRLRPSSRVGALSCHTPRLRPIPRPTRRRHRHGPRAHGASRAPAGRRPSLRQASRSPSPSRRTRLRRLPTIGATPTLAPVVETMTQPRRALPGPPTQRFLATLRRGTLLPHRRTQAPSAPLTRGIRMALGPPSRPRRRPPAPPLPPPSPPPRRQRHTSLTLLTTPLYRATTPSRHLTAVLSPRSATRWMLRRSRRRPLTR